MGLLDGKVAAEGHFTVMRPATRHMPEKPRGRIITFTSTAGLEEKPFSSSIVELRAIFDD